MAQAMTNLLEPFVQRLSKDGCLSPLDIEALRGLEGFLERVAPHHEMVRMGDRTEWVPILIGGYAGQFEQTASGKRQIVSLYVPGDAVNLHSTVGAPNRASGCVALTQASYVRVSSNCLAELASTSSSLAQALAREVSLELVRATRWLRNLGQLQVAARIAHLYCEVSCRISNSPQPREGRWIDFAPRQSDVAEMTGCSLVHTSRSYQTLRQMGFVEIERRGFRVIDFQRLADCGEFEPSYLALSTPTVRPQLEFAQSQRGGIFNDNRTAAV